MTTIHRLRQQRQYQRPTTNYEPQTNFASNAHVRFSKCRKNTNFYKKVRLFDNFLQKNAPFCAFFTSFSPQHAHLVAPKCPSQPKKANSKLKIQNYF
jgi:hypothetical protein